MKLTSLVGSTSLLLLSLRVFAAPALSNGDSLSLRDSKGLIGKQKPRGFITLYNPNTDGFKEQRSSGGDFNSIAKGDHDSHDKRDLDRHDRHDTEHRQQRQEGPQSP
jgi:hypothetical protein